jgi:hypothetical protein
VIPLPIFRDFQPLVWQRLPLMGKDKNTNFPASPELIQGQMHGHTHTDSLTWGIFLVMDGVGVAERDPLRRLAM